MQNFPCSPPLLKRPRRANSAIFLRLPKVAWINVWTLLDVADLMVSRQVCRLWKSQIESPVVWRAKWEDFQEWKERQRSGAPAFKSLSLSASTGALGGDPSLSPEEMRAECIELFIQWKAESEPFEPQSERAAQLLDDAANAEGEDVKVSLWEQSEAIEESGRLFFDQGRFWESCSDFDRSIACYRRAVKLCPYNHEVRTRLGLVYHKCERFRDALREYEKSTLLKNDYQLAYNNAGSIYFNQADYARALECFARCIDLDENASVAFNNRGLCHFLEGQLVEAVGDFTRAIALNNADITARPNRAVVYLAQGEYDAAIADVRDAMTRAAATQSKVELPYLHKHMGHALLRKNDVEGAIRELSAALEKKEGYKQALELLSQALAQQGNADEAKKAMEQAASLPNIVGNTETIFYYFLR